MGVHSGAVPSNCKHFLFFLESQTLYALLCNVKQFTEVKCTHQAVSKKRLGKLLTIW